MKLESEVVIHTDGGCNPNPGIGGWGAIIQYIKADKIIEKELTGGDNDTTNNRMEMTAVMLSLRALKRPCHVVVYTDSKYVQQGIGSWKNGEPTIKGWMVDWREKGWRRKEGELQNAKLWKELYDEVIRHKSVKMKHVRGHMGHELNERCDELATRAREEQLLKS